MDKKALIGTLPPEYNTQYGEPINSSGQSQYTHPPPQSSTSTVWTSTTSQSAPSLTPYKGGSCIPNDPEYQNSPEAGRATAKDTFQIKSFTEKSIRLGFVRKVFGILTVQMLVTFGIMAVFVYYKPVADFAQTHDWMWMASMGTVFFLVIVLACCGNIRRISPYNYLLLALFTLAMSWMLGCIVAYFTAKEVWMSVGIVCVITLCMCILGMQSKIDLTWTVGLLMILLISMIGFAILCAAVQTEYAYLALTAFGAGIFSVWLLVDIKLLMGKSGVAIDPEEYVFAALNIYLDIINILLRILIIVGFAKCK